MADNNEKLEKDLQNQEADIEVNVTKDVAEDAEKQPEKEEVQEEPADDKEKESPEEELKEEEKESEEDKNKEESKEENKANWLTLLKNAPSTLWKVGLVQFFCLAAFLYLWNYSTGAIAETVWNTTDASSEAYQEADNWVGILFAVQAVMWRCRCDCHPQEGSISSANVCTDQK